VGNKEVVDFVSGVLDVLLCNKDILDYEYHQFSFQKSYSHVIEEQLYKMDS